MWDFLLPCRRPNSSPLKPTPVENRLLYTSPIRKAVHCYRCIRSGVACNNGPGGDICSEEVCCLAWSAQYPAPRHSAALCARQRPAAVSGSAGSRPRDRAVPALLPNNAASWSSGAPEPSHCDSGHVHPSGAAAGSGGRRAVRMVPLCDVLAVRGAGRGVTSHQLVLLLTERYSCQLETHSLFF